MTSLSSAAAMRAASIVTATNVLVASGLSLAGLISSQSVLPAADTPSGASHIFRPLCGGPHGSAGVVALAAIDRQSAKALLVLGALAGVVQLLDAGVGALQGDLGKTLGPFLIALLQFAAVFFLASTIDPRAPE